MSVRHLFAAAPTALLGSAGQATSPVVHLLVEPAGAYTMTAGRLWALVAMVLGLAGVAVGGLALARSAGRIRVGDARSGAVVALVAGLTGTVVGGLVVAAADGGPGAGYGIVGGYVALVVGPAAAVVSGLALSRSRRAGDRSA
ncbi:DUF6223 family protein [Microbispora sp. H11081]|uniref:DUF6223 family protein n=1 Tax=Microbispora sp. H11081 TaxID=2729107 RepID=UPI0014757BDC|nr:DUF6223 family protein [Microbispora sp. H11081]